MKSLGHWNFIPILTCRSKPNSTSPKVSSVLRCTKHFKRSKYRVKCFKEFRPSASSSFPGLYFVHHCIGSLYSSLVTHRCSSDLVHLYANIKEYLDRPMSFAYLGVCIPKIAMDADMNLLETLKLFFDFNNKEKVDQLGEFTEPIHLCTSLIGNRSLAHCSMWLHFSCCSFPRAFYSRSD